MSGTNICGIDSWSETGVPSPIAHSATALLLARFYPISPETNGKNQDLRVLSAAVLIANLPDLDFLPQIITGERFHHGPTHSIIFVIGFSLFVALITRYRFKTHKPSRAFVFSFSIYASHLLLDMITTGGQGIQVLWPVSMDYYRADFSVFPRVAWDLPLFHPSHWMFIGFESIYALVLITCAYTLKRYKYSNTALGNRVDGR